MFDQILDLVGQPPGSMVYHFIILFAIQAALAMAAGQWMRERSSSTARLAIGIFAAFMARSLVLIASLVAWQGLLPTNEILPPVERAADTLTIIALGWTFVTMDDPAILRRNFYADLIATVLGVGMTLPLAGGSYYLWRGDAQAGQLFNGYILDYAWGIAQIAIALIAFVWMLTRIRYVYDPFLKGAMLLLLGGSVALHLIDPVLGDVAAAMRVGQVLVMPMLAAVTYRHVVEQLLHYDEFEPSRLQEETPAQKMRPISMDEPISPPRAIAPPPESLQETVRSPEVIAQKQKPVTPQILEVVDALGGLLATMEQSEIVKQAPRAVATALRADMAALAIVDEEAQQAGIVGGYDNITQAFLPRTLLDLADHPGIVNALGRLRQIRLTPDRDQKELRDFFMRLGIVHEGPAYVQPLVNGDERLGVLIVGSPYSERQFSNDERNLLDRLSPLVAAALLNVERHETLREEAQRDLGEESARMVGLADELTAKTTELNDARRQNEEMKAYIRDLHRQVDGVPQQQEASREQLELLAAEVDRLRAENEEVDRLRDQLETASTALTQLQETNQRLIESKTGDPSIIAQLQAENQRLREEAIKVQLLQSEIDQLRNRSAGVPHPTDTGSYDRSWDDARLAAQAEIASLRARLAQATISQQEVGFLQEQLAIKAREGISLQTRLAEAQAVADALREQVAGGVSNTRELEMMQARVAQQASQISMLKMHLTEAEAGNIDPAALHASAAMDQADRDAMNQLEAQLRERSALVDALEQQLSDKARAVGELKGYMSDVEASLRHLEGQFATKADEVERLQSTLEDARTLAQERIAVLEASRATGVQMEQAHLSALEAELAEKSAAVEMLEHQLEDSRQAMVAMEQQLNETRRAVDSAIAGARQVESHDEVIASIAQELRTPMSSIMGYTDLLLRESVGILGTIQRKFLQRVKANTERMGSLLDDLIRITALDTGRMRLEPVRVDVTYAIEEAVMGVANQYREKGLVLRLAMAENLPAITADRDALLQLIGHLLSNAALASRIEGEVQLMVTARRDSLPVDGTSYETDCLYLAVEDSGEGIAADDFERVFARKYRADNTLIEGLGDTGVSLSLAKALVDAHSGRIWLDSAKGSGSTFHVLLPLQPMSEEMA